MFKRLQKNVGEVLELSSDILDNGPRITIMGRNEIMVEYYEEVVQFSDEEITLKTPAGNVVIKGKGFVLTTVLQTEIHIKGSLLQLSFEEEV